jgi:hypothetical protein
MANRFDNFDKIDFYAGIVPEFIKTRVTPYLKEYFNDNQMLGATFLRSLLAGFGLFEGLSGTGKIYFLFKIIILFVIFDKIDGIRHRVLVTCLINNPFNDIVLKFQSFIKIEFKDSERKFMIIRYHTVAIEQEIVIKLAKDIRGPKDGDRSFI